MKRLPMKTPQMKARLARLVVFALPVLVFLINFGLFQDPVNKVIDRDDRNQGMVVRAHWRWYVDPTVLVYDLRDAPADATGVDVLRAFLHFAYKQKGRQFVRVDLAWRGERRFSINGGDFAELGRQYVVRSPVDTMTVMPGILYRPDGSKAFPVPPGSSAQQNSQRLLEFTSFVNTWTTR
jgi:hypothetical protein